MNTQRYRMTWKDGQPSFPILPPDDLIHASMERGIAIRNYISQLEGVVLGLAHIAKRESCLVADIHHPAVDLSAITGGGK